jgi:hypothetical protein
MTDFDALRKGQDLAYAALLLRDYFEVKSELEAHEARADDLRRDLTVLVEALGGSLKVDHLGTALITPQSTAHSYDTKAIDAIQSKALQDGDVHTAKAIADARKETTRKATLRITGVKK